MKEKKTYVCLKCGRVYKPSDKDYSMLEAAREVTKYRMITQYDINPDEINADVSTCPTDEFIVIPKDYFRNEKDFKAIANLSGEIFKTFGVRAFMNIGDQYTYVKIGCDSRIFDLILGWINEAPDEFGIQCGFSNRFINEEVCYDIEFYNSNHDFYRIASYLANKIRIYRWRCNFNIKYIHPIKSTPKEKTNEA